MGEFCIGINYKSTKFSLEPMPASTTDHFWLNKRVGSLEMIALLELAELWQIEHQPERDSVKVTVWSGSFTPKCTKGQRTAAYYDLDCCTRQCRPARMSSHLNHEFITLCDVQLVSSSAFETWNATRCIYHLWLLLQWRTIGYPPVRQETLVVWRLHVLSCTHISPGGDRVSFAY